MKTTIFIVMLLVSKTYLHAQKRPEDFGFRHLAMKFQNDPVDVIIISKANEAKMRKPLFFFCQGSLPQPVIKYDNNESFGVLPFDETILLNHFHIVIIGKPFIPVIANATTLAPNFTYYKDANDQRPPKGYTDRNFLDYYVTRNNFVLRLLLKERWAATGEVVVAGHSEGATIAAKMTVSNTKITHLIYSGGNPYGRIASMLAEARANDKDTMHNGNDVISYWKTVVDSSDKLHTAGGDSPKTTYDFSEPQIENLLQLKIPVLVTYGTKDWSLPYNDLFYIETIRSRKSNFTFKPYLNLEHNFFTVEPDSNLPGETYNWDAVAADWHQWLNLNRKS